MVRSWGCDHPTQKPAQPLTSGDTHVPIQPPCSSGLSYLQNIPKDSKVLEKLIPSHGLSLGRHKTLAGKIKKRPRPFTRRTFSYPTVTVDSLLPCGDLAGTDVSPPGHVSGMDEGQAQGKGEHPKEEPLAGSTALWLGCSRAGQCMRQAWPGQRDKSPSAFSSCPPAAGPRLTPSTSVSPFRHSCLCAPSTGSHTSK